ncbi:hypothetical protein LJR039_004099 [Pseudorhodoferax sp. LjRoot39]|uniref:hypothetical protein n=1 Tax=Pseudorhodoferax sp. LjRoot39 TaxID=3342328 RepID=UPI003ED0E553
MLDLLRYRITIATLLFALLAGCACAAAMEPNRATGVRHGLTPAETRALYKFIDAQQLHIEKFARDLGLTVKTLRAIAFELGLSRLNSSSQQFIDLLRVHASDAARLKKDAADFARKLAQLDPSGQRARALEISKQAQDAFDDGRLADAEVLYESLVLLRWRDHKDALFALVDSVKLRTEIAVLRGDAAAVDRTWAEIDQTQSTLETHGKWSRRMGHAHDLLRIGLRFRKVEEIHRAILIIRDEALPLTQRSIVPLDWAATLDALGRAQLKYGELSLRSHAADAATSFRRALEERTIERSPIDWAASRHSLAEALLSIDDDANRLTNIKEAIENFRLALKVRTREKYPTEWSSTQAHLSYALAKLGTFNRDDALLDEALHVARLAAEVQPAPEDAVEWAQTRHAIGEAIGEVAAYRTSDSNLAREAIGHLEESKRHLSVELQLSEWLRVQLSLVAAHYGTETANLGKTPLIQSVATLRQMAERVLFENDPNLWSFLQLGLAILISQNSMDEYQFDANQAAESLEIIRKVMEKTSENPSLEIWKFAHFSQGYVLFQMGKRESGTDRLRQSAHSYEIAMQEPTPDIGLKALSIARLLVAMTNIELAHRGKSIQHAEYAVHLIRAVLSSNEHSKDFEFWGQSQFLLGWALHLHGALDANPKFLAEAVEAYQRSIDGMVGKDSPDSSSDSYLIMAFALLALDAVEPHASHVTAAIQSIRMSVTLLVPNHDPSEWSGMSTITGMLSFQLKVHEKLHEALKRDIQALQENLRSSTYFDRYAFEANGMVMCAIADGWIESGPWASTVREVVGQVGRKVNYSNPQTQQDLIKALDKVLEIVSSKQPGFPLVSDQKSCANTLNGLAKFFESSGRR